MALQGTLSTTNVLEVFSLLHQLRKNGLLIIVSESCDRSFLFKEGNLLFGSSRDGTNTLGSFLDRSRQELEETAETSVHGQGSPYIGQRFIKAGVLSPGELEKALRAQVLSLLEEILSWSHGAFVFLEGEMPNTLPQSGFLNTSSILLQATSTCDEKAQARAMFQDLGAVLRHAPFAVTTHLTPAEEEVYSTVDGAKTVEEILAAGSHTSDFNTILYTLIRAGILELCQEITPDRATGCALYSCPCIPAELAARIQQTVLSRAPFDEAATFASDPVLLTRYLRFFCSAHRDPNDPLTTISMLTANQDSLNLRATLLAEATRSLYLGKRGAHWDVAWSHAERTAHTAKAIAEHVEYPYPDEAFMAGLLHNLGAFLLLQKNPLLYRSIANESYTLQRDIESMEEESFGVSHTRIGSLCAAQWSLPRNFTDVIRYHHQETNLNRHPIHPIVAAAVSAATDAGLRVGFSKSQASLRRAALKALGLSSRRLGSIADGSRSLVAAFH